MLPSARLRQHLHGRVAEYVRSLSSDRVDVLANVAFAQDPKTRAQRADSARAAAAASGYSEKQRWFVEFVLAQYVKQGADELDVEKIAPLLRLTYNNVLNDAFAELGEPEQVRQVFVEFQQYL